MSNDLSEDGAGNYAPDDIAIPAHLEAGLPRIPEWWGRPAAERIEAVAEAVAETHRQEDVSDEQWERWVRHGLVWFLGAAGLLMLMASCLG